MLSSAAAFGPAAARHGFGCPAACLRRALRVWLRNWGAARPTKLAACKDTSQHALWPIAALSPYRYARQQKNLTELFPSLLASLRTAAPQNGAHHSITAGGFGRATRGRRGSG